MADAIGWTELLDGNMILAVFTMFNTAFMGWFVPILFIVYESMLLIKTKNLMLSWLTGIIFVSLYATTQFASATVGIPLLYVMLVFELAGILYFLIWK